MPTPQPAPELAIERWYNSDQPLTLAGLAGRVVVLEAFQMLCPGCVAHGLPQAQRIERIFADSGVTVLGLHTVFEHHDAMPPVALEAFLHEYRIRFPVAVDQPNDRGIPETMRRYAMRGTPTLILIDAGGRLRQQWFGQQDDLVIGAEIMRLLLERDRTDVADARPRDAAGGCTPDGCSL